MAKYIVRFRKVQIMKIKLDAQSYREAFEIFKQKIAEKHFITKSDVIGLHYEIETITLGCDNDHQSKGIPDEYKNRRSNSD